MQDGPTVCLTSLRDKPAPRRVGKTTMATQEIHVDGGAPGPGEVVHSGLRGAIAAMSMTGMRAFTVNLGLLKEDPPNAIFRQKVSGLLKPFPRKRRGAIVELAHW